MSYLNLRGLNKTYGGAPILTDINCAVEKGEFITLLGPSGCGKSTLLRCIAGLSDPDSGEILLDGQDITQRPPQKRGVGMVFQNYSLFPHLTVAENIAFGLRLKNLDSDDVELGVFHALRRVGMGNFTMRFPDELSGGQRQRVALARTLALEPQLLLLDEPFSALDAPIRRELRETLRTVQQELGITTLFVTHDQEEALSISDRIFVMSAGRIIDSDSAENLYQAPRHSFTAGFIGHFNLLKPDIASQLLERTVTKAVMIRPETIDLVPHSNLPAQITSRMLLGNVIRYRVRAKETDLIVDVLNRGREPIPTGAQVYLQFDPASIREME